MKKKELIILTARDRFFGQTRKPWTSLDVNKIAKELNNKGFGVEMYDFHEVVNEDLNLEHKIILYAFSQKENYRQYIKDIMFHLSKKNEIIPSYDLLMCHENKGYQEIYNKETGLNSLWGLYFTSAEELDFQAFAYPVVLKTTSGSNGKGVFLIQDALQMKNVTRRLQKRIGMGKKLDLLRRKYARHKTFPEYPEFSDEQDYIEYKEYIKAEENFVIQEFVPDLKYDHRVLIACDRYYVMKREIKDGDFRASGSKMFVFNVEPDTELLEFSRSVYEKFDSPFLSIDVLFDGKNYFLAEYQALHFGMAVQAQSKGFFKRNEAGEWIFKKEKPNLEKVFAKTLLCYLNEKYFSEE